MTTNLLKTDDERDSDREPLEVALKEIMREYWRLDITPHVQHALWQDTITLTERSRYFSCIQTKDPALREFKIRAFLNSALTPTAIAFISNLRLLEGLSDDLKVKLRAIEEYGDIEPSSPSAAQLQLQPASPTLPAIESEALSVEKPTRSNGSFTVLLVLVVAQILLFGVGLISQAEPGLIVSLAATSVCYHCSCYLIWRAISSSSLRVMFALLCSAALLLFEIFLLRNHAG